MQRKQHCRIASALVHRRFIEGGFTLVELMVVVLIIGIIATAAMPLLKGRIDSVKWSEAKAAMGNIASALRTYAVEKRDFSSPPLLNQIGIQNTDLDGTYFTHEAYEITSASASNGQVSFVITAIAASSTRSAKPIRPATMTLTCNSGNNYTTTFAEGS